MNPRRRFGHAALLSLGRFGCSGRGAAGCLVPALAGLTVREATAQTALPATPADMLGPYYPVNWSGEVDADLTELAGRRYADGQLMLLSGRVLSVQGRPVESALIEIWQTDATGRYRHPDDDGEGPARRGFQGYGRTRADADGQYRFRTIKPVIYGGRPPHVHLKVVHPAHRPLVTQLYFDGENQERGFFGGFSRERDRLTIKLGRTQDQGRELLSARFDLVLAAA